MVVTSRRVSPCGGTPPSGKAPLRVDIPVAVLDQPQSLILRCIAYARRLFHVSPSRSFPLVLSFRPDIHELRLLIFHRGGLTASKPLDVRRRPDHEDILRLFLSILLWTTPKDAGFIASCNEQNMPFRAILVIRRGLWLLLNARCTITTVYTDVAHELAVYPFCILQPHNHSPTSRPQMIPVRMLFI